MSLNDGSTGNVPRERWGVGPAGRLRVLEATPPELSAPEPVVFVHGFGGDASWWSGQLGHVAAAGRRALALDLRGHGRSEPPKDAETGYRVPALAGDVLAVAQSLELGRFVLVGHSLGAQVAGELAGAHPERVSALILVDPPGDNPRLPEEIVGPYRQALASDDYRQTVARFVDGLLANARPEVQARVLGALDEAPRDKVVGTTLATLDYSVIPAVVRYRDGGGRALTITADQNQGPLALHTLVADLPRRHVAKTSHYIHLDQPGQVNEIIDEVLSGAAWHEGAGRAARRNAPEARDSGR